MQFSIEAGLMKDILEDLNLIANGGKLPFMPHLKIDVRDGKVIFFAVGRTASMAREIKADTPRPGMATIPAKSCLELVKSFSKEKLIGFSLINDKTIRVTHSRSRFNLSTTDPLSFPVVDFPNVEYDPIVSESFLDAISRVIPSTAADESYGIFLHAVFFEPAESEGFMRAVASDGHRLTTCKFPGVIKSPFLLPKESVLILKKVLSKSEEFGLFIEKDQMFIKLESGFVSFRLYDNKFPNYRAILPRGSYTEIVCDRKLAIETLTRTLLFTDPDNSKITMSISKVNNSVTLKSQTTDGDAEDIIVLKDTGDIKSDISLNINGKYVEQMLSKFDKDDISIRIYGEITPVVFLDKSNIMGIIVPLKK